MNIAEDVVPILGVNRSSNPHKSSQRGSLSTIQRMKKVAFAAHPQKKGCFDVTENEIEG